MASITVDHDVPIGSTYHLLTGHVDFDSAYPSGGEALDPSGVASIETLICSAKGGYTYEWDQANQKLKVYRTAGHAHDLLIKGGQAASTTNDVAYYSSDILGKEQATDKTILGSASATKGGVIANADVALEEATGDDLSSLTGVKFIALAQS